MNLTTRGMILSLMRIEDFLVRLEADNTRSPRRHILNPPLNQEQLAAWRKTNPRSSLPPDYVELLLRVNGFRLEADDDLPTGAHGAARLFPLSEVQYAARTFYLDNTSCDDLIPKSWLGILEIVGEFGVLDVTTGTYMRVDSVVVDEPITVAKNVEGLLDWVSQFLESPK